MLPLRCVPPEMGDLQEVLFCFFPLERIRRLVDTRQARGAGERGRTAELCSCCHSAT